MDSAPQGSIPSPLTSSRGIKKILSNRSRTSLADPGSESSSTRGLRTSTDSTRDRSPNNLSRNSSRDDSSKSGSSGIRKLIPGHAKRKRRRMRENAAMLHPESESTDSNPAINITNAPASLERHHSSTSLLQDDNSSLLTDDSEPSS
jgi:hypothetical protein